MTPFPRNANARRVQRRTVHPCATVRRRVVVELAEGDCLRFREEGRRTWYTAPVGKVFVQVVKWNTAAKREKKQGKGKHNGNANV